MTGLDPNLILRRIEDIQCRFTEWEGSTASLLELILEHACELTGSNTGFISQVYYTVLQEPQLQIKAIKRLAFSTALVSDYTQEGTKGRETEACYGNLFLQNLATEVLFTLKPLFYNQPYYWQQLPLYSKMPIQNFMALPLIFRRRVIAVIGLSNAPTDYGHTLIEQLRPFFNTCSLIVESLFSKTSTRENYARNQNQSLCFLPSKFKNDDKTFVNLVKEIVERESKLRNIINNLNDVIWSASIDDSILYFVSDACQKLYGHEPKSFYTDRMLWFKVIHPDDAVRVMASQATLLKNGFIDHEYRIVTSKGEIKWVINRVWVIKDEKGNPVRMDGITKDATLRRKAIEKLHNALDKEHKLNLQLIRREEELAAHEEELSQVNKQLSTTIEQLKKSEKALRKAQHLAKIGNFECDLLKKQMFYSQEADVILGIDISKMDFSSQRDTFINIVHPEDKPRVLGFILKILSGKRSGGKLQYRIITDKEIKYIFAYIDKIQKDQHEKVTLISGIIQDVTGTVLSIHQLKEERVRSELALWGGDLGLWDWDIQTDVVTYNQRWAEMLGYSLSEIAPTIDSWKNLIHPEDEKNVSATISAHLEGKTPFFQLEHRLRSKSGDWIWILDSGKVIKWDSEGKPIRAIGTHKDITDKKLAEEEVRKLALVAQKTENGVIITDADGITEWVNEGFTRITGFDNQEMKGKKPGDVLHGPETDTATKNLMHERISKGQEFHTEILNYNKTGEKYWVRLDVQPIFNQQGRLQQFIAIQTDITKRKQVEQQLNFQANILRNVKESVIVTDLHGKVIYYNQGAEAIFGYTAQEMLGNELVSLYYERPSSKERKKIWGTLISGQPFDGEWQGKNKNNTLVWVHVTTTLLLNELGEPIGLIGVSKDITDRKKAEDKLKRNEAYLQSIFDATIQAYFLLDSAYNIIKFNKTASDAINRIHGKELRIGDNIIDYSDKNALEDFKKNVQKAFSGQNVFSSRELFFGNGQQLWFEVQYLPARNEHNEIYGVAFVSLDITQRKQTEIALLKSYQEVHNFKNALYTSASISVTDTCGIITEVNESFCSTSGYEREELIGQTHKLINSDYHSDEFFNDMWKSISAGKTWKGEIKNKAKNGAYYWLDTSITPILDENGQIIQYLSVRYLITERKKAEEDREALIKNLTRFAFMTAHNLRGPLARIQGLVSIINLDDPADPINKSALEKLTISAQELDAVIFKMIDMVNLSELK